ncbi:MAG: amidohydrolase family protein [Alphaproteobacteria bacterium]|nr:amidohydrolase family protein [Alphaproteobacteria bacterium]MBU0797702.1 amidohydrolase family protein [Alphaproteobacteria bacterium]MBU0885905.1 amidohydrolase family protein [Alphaproteobacteria bacterium]MBU1814595.1 amidohydrolase family protein [Alphaproteobacteria bacterium]MBU2089195.1 amidohydrolase family protein [Alphaproteobacteria bacterium]
MTTLFTGASIIDGQGKALKDHALLVQDGKIARIAPSGEFSGYDGAKVDAKGMTLLPGLIDCHVHLCMGAEGNPSVFLQSSRPDQITMRALEHAQITLRGGTTAVRDCGGKDYLEFAVRDACNTGKQLGPTIRAAGRMICMTGGHGNRYGRIADGVDDVVKAVREQVHAGSDLIKIMATGGVMTPGVNPEDAHYSAEELAAGIAEGHRFHKTCASHAQGEEGILNAVRGGIDSIEHGIFLTQQCIDEMLPRGTYIVPTLAAVFNIVRNKDNGVPVYAYEKAARVAERHKESIRMYYKAGGNLAMGTDAGTPYNKHGENARELEYMVDIGITPMDAITISTRNAADLMQLGDRGHIAEGQAADLLLVKGDPLANIKAVADAANHVMVLKNGIAAVDRRSTAGAMRLAAE